MHTDLCRNPIRTVLQVRSSEQYLNEMNCVVPRADLVSVIEPTCPKTNGPGRPPWGSSACCGCIVYNRGSPYQILAVEEALYDSLAIRKFVVIDLGREPVPDEATICKFRHPREAHQLVA